FALRTGRDRHWHEDRGTVRRYAADVAADGALNRLQMATSLVRRARDRRFRPTGRRRDQVSAVIRYGHPVACNMGGWPGEDVDGRRHSESLFCPGCGSIARDRFLYECWTTRTRYNRESRVLETSPRLGEDYHERMQSLVRYQSCDFDMRTHKAG